MQPQNIGSTQVDSFQQSSKKVSQRFATLDVFRGMTIFLMIVVNTPGSGAQPYAPLEHATWHGFTLTDLVFPSFLFAVGNAMAFSMKKFEQEGSRYFFIQVLKRTFLIFLLGYLISWYPFIKWNEGGKMIFKPIDETRIMGVLQRIALAFAFASIIVRYFNTKWIVVSSILILFVYWALLYFLGTPYSPYSLQGNVVRQLDLFLFSAKHMYREQGVAFDPEGLLSTLPSIVNVTAGYLVGKFLVQRGKSKNTIILLLLTAGVLILAGLSWNYVFPINKKLWTSSYTVLTIGIDIAILAILFFLIEMKNLKAGVSFFSVLGRNPLFIYILADVIAIFFYIPIFGVYVFDSINNVAQNLVPGSLGSLLFAIVYALICWSFGWVLDKKKIYIRL